MSYLKRVDYFSCSRCGIVVGDEAGRAGDIDQIRRHRQRVHVPGPSVVVYARLDVRAVVAADGGFSQLQGSFSCEAGDSYP